MRSLISVILVCSYATSSTAFSHPSRLGHMLSWLSPTALKALPTSIVDEITIDQIFAESDAKRIDSLNQPIQVAAVGGSVKARVHSSKSVSIYRSTSCDIEDTSNDIMKKVPLLFLPGLDGVGNYSSNSVGKLNLVFDVWKMATKGDDRSTFLELAAIVMKALDTFDEPVVLVGESFGGLLAAYVALRAKEGKIAQLVLVNPATSYDQTNWNLFAPLIAGTGRAFPIFGISALMATAVDIAQVRRVGGQIISSVVSSPGSAGDRFSNLFEAGKYLLDLIPPETLNWRISKWFGAGTSIMEGKYSQIKTPTLILVGKNDRLLPSQLEGKRLLKEMSGSKKVEVKEFNVGHALLEDNFIDFAAVMLRSSVFAVPKEDPLDVTFPTKADMIDVEKQVRNSEKM